MGASIGTEDRLTGKVKWFDAQKGYGFIERPGESDVFVYHKHIQMQGYRELFEGDEVEYEVVETERGPQARNVVRIKEAERTSPTRRHGDRDDDDVYGGHQPWRRR